MRDVGLLVLRLTAGGLLAGHGAQKLFGAFGGRGLQATTGTMESLGMKPGQKWAVLAGGSEFAGGVLTALGFLHPLGPITMLAPMSTATATAHWGKPIWVTSGGAELPVTNIAIATALLFVGPGSISADRVLGIRLPRPLIALALAATVAGTAYGLLQREPRAAPEEAKPVSPRAEAETGVAPAEEEAAMAGLPTGNQAPVGEYAASEMGEKAAEEESSTVVRPSGERM